MNAHPKFIANTAHVDDAAVQPLPRSRKVYATGSRADIQVPMREISQTDTPAAFGAEVNPPVYVYDTSGPYTDPAPRVGAERLADPRLAELRFELKRQPRRAKAGANVSQMHYARRGLVT